MTDKYANLRARLAALKLAGPVSTDARAWNAATDALDVELVAELLAERDAMVQAQPAAVSDEEIDRIIERAGEAVGMSPGGWDVVDPRELVRAILALRPQSESKWDGAEEWMPLAWELCAEEHGEEACNKLIWTGGPIPEPWGDRWLQYEDEAKRLISLVRKHVPSLRPQAVPMTWPTDRDVGRYGDMHPLEHMRVGLDSDNDVYVSLWGEGGGAAVEFCNPGGGGGGSSRRTREALIALMVAMEADNAERPDKDWWARRNGITAQAKGGE